MIVGWMFCSMRASARFRSSPARMTAVVVPSPASWSWVFATSTSIFAAGCSTSISLRIVTPSFVTTTSPIESTSILSSPRGPRVERTASAIAFAAAMLFERAPASLLSLRPFLQHQNRRLSCQHVFFLVRDSSRLSSLVEMRLYLILTYRSRERNASPRRWRPCSARAPCSVGATGESYFGPAG